MDARLIEYIAALGGPEELQGRVTALIESYETLLEEEIGAWFVSEYVDNEGQRTFESLWLFTESFIMEGQLIGADEDQFDFVPFRNGIRQIAVAKRSFEFSQATASSRMTVEAWLEDRRYLVMRATGDNCAALFDILQTVLLPNAGGSST